MVLEDLLLDYPLMNYAMGEWPHHMKLLDMNATLELFYQQQEFFSNDSQLQDYCDALNRSLDAHQGLRKPSALHLACELGLYYLVKHLLTERRRRLIPRLRIRSLINMAEEKDGFTPLHHASRKGHDHVVSLLLDHGADPVKESINSYMHSGRCNPVSLSIQHGYCRIFHQLVEMKRCGRWLRQEAASNGLNLLHYAARVGSEEICDILIERFNFKVNSIECKYHRRKQTPLAVAICGGHISLARRLIQKHNASTNDHCMLLLAACDGVIRDPGTLRFVVQELQIDINSVDEMGNPVFFNVVNGIQYSSQFELAMEHLASLGYDFDKLNDNGQNILHPFADNERYGLTLHESWQYLELLLRKARLNINAQDCKGNTPLHISILSIQKHFFPWKVQRTVEKMRAFVIQLLDFGADRTIVDREGNTAHDIVLQHLSDNRGQKLARFKIAEKGLVSLGMVLEKYTTVPADATVVTLSRHIFP
ncbi:hypothetical protein FALBO_1093 [Fusarium albosuccineum]|uniref:Ankyrin n=1 Tax=Fusarium albosuccineum TaxID=1237068 RepID=A0A8H4PIP1_9HYPO|nr:hypothetical protein FALBO_1093 [Fusarium albosuccineum]